MSAAKLLDITFLLLGFSLAFFFTGKAIYHAFHIVTNVKGKYASFLGPLVLVVPGQLTADGERHRRPFAVSLAGVAVGWAVLFAIGAVNG